MFFVFIRQLRPSKHFASSDKDTTDQSQPSRLKVKINIALRQYEQRLSYHQKKIILLLFCACSVCFFTWLLIESLVRQHPLRKSAGGNMVAPAPPILSDTHSLPQLWQQLHTYSDSIHHQSSHHDTIKDQ